MQSSKIWPFPTLSISHYKLKKQKEDVYEQDIQQQEEGKGLNKEFLLIISHVLKPLKEHPKIYLALYEVFEIQEKSTIQAISPKELQTYPQVH